MNCTRCQHPLDQHCKSEVAHADMKDEKPGITPRVTVCHTRHCLNPLCSCVDFEEAL